MDAALLKTTYDFILLGTGLVESILAAALSRAGKSVLHLDQNDFYGSNHATLHFTPFHQSLHTPPQIRTLSHTTDIPITRSSTISVSNTFANFNSPESRKSLESECTRYNLDILSPRMLFASEELVHLLISSGVGRYLEFTALEGYFLHIPGNSSHASLASVPSSKRDVFQSDYLSMSEKRVLMKFLQFVADIGDVYFRGEVLETKNERDLALGRALKRPQNKSAPLMESMEEYEQISFLSLLKHKFKMSEKLMQVVWYCIALDIRPMHGESAQQTLALQKLEDIYRYVSSLGKFTASAFLVPMYGISELSQSFCRLSAVYGGIYILKAPIESFVVTESDALRISGIRTQDGNVLKGKHFIANAMYRRDLVETENSNKLIPLRGIFILSSSLNALKRFFIVIPPDDPKLLNSFAIYILQLDESSGVCPSERYVIQFSTKVPSLYISEKKHCLLMKNIKQLLLSYNDQNETEENQSTDSGPEILYEAVFSMKDEPMENVASRIPNNITFCEYNAFHNDARRNCDGMELGFDSAVGNAKAIFSNICPGEEFLMKSEDAEQAEQAELDDEQQAVLSAAQRLANQTAT